MKKMVQKIDAKWYWLLMTCAVGSFLFLLFASPFNTPLNSYYGYDSAFFLLIGKGIRHGLRPYLDLYDQKGPMIFYINALGWWMTDSRLGVFLLQTVFMTAVLFVLWKLSRLFLGLRGTALVMLLFTLLFCGTVNEGNMTEEWSLIFSFLPMYLSLRYICRGKDLGSHPLGYSLIYGVCIAVQLLFRVTNACLVGGMILGFTILFSLKKDFSGLARNAAAVLAGIAVVIVPFCLYFQRIGAMEAFLYASVLHNFNYAVGGAEAKTTADWAVTLLSVAPVLATLIMTPRFLRQRVTESPVMVLLNSMGLTGALAMTVGYGWRHYYLLIVPVIVVDACIWLRWIAGCNKPLLRRRVAVVALAVAFLLPYAPQMVRHLGKVVLYDVFHELDGEVQRYEEVSAYIPAGAEKVWGYNVNAKAYLYLNILPSFRYFALQEWMAEQDPFIREEIETMLREDPPAIIFLSRSETEMRERLVSEYGYMCIAELDSNLNYAIYRK